MVMVHEMVCRNKVVPVLVDPAYEIGDWVQRQCEGLAPIPLPSKTGTAGTADPDVAELAEKVAPPPFPPSTYTPTHTHHLACVCFVRTSMCRERERLSEV